MPYISLEINAEDVVELMSNDGNFALDMWSLLAERIDMGAMRDDAGDLTSCLKKSHVEFMAAQFINLGEAMKNGYNLANHDQID